ncbi:hypothetical protein QYE76_039285 [Lolium multiflorum]|uniref:Retrotransposon gag domain-containing protein n=1 Tax=Lolium multiflorum TaxID=4521 RepID=A0AAD8WRP1_LOLMU|nr:hypothetical protein QYE76_039285 [Lolium multiflorum]
MAGSSSPARSARLAAATVAVAAATGRGWSSSSSASMISVVVFTLQRLHTCDEDIPTSLLPPSLPTEDEPAVKPKSNEVRIGPMTRARMKRRQASQRRRGAAGREDGREAGQGAGHEDISWTREGGAGGMRERRRRSPGRSSARPAHRRRRSSVDRGINRQPGEECIVPVEAGNRRFRLPTVDRTTDRTGRSTARSAGFESRTVSLLSTRSIRDNKIVNQENKNSADIITWREYEALRNEMRREFRTKDDELKDMRLAIENLTAQQQQQDDDEDPDLKMTHTMLVVRLVVIVLVAGFHLARGQDEEDGLGKPKFSIPKFEGGADVEEYLTWELKIEKLWSLHPNYSEDKKIKLASSEFDGYALRWWDSLVRNRDEDGAQPIRTWRAMKEVMTSRFVPTNYMRNIFDKLTLLRQGVKTVDEYYMEMEMLMQRGRVRESLEMTMQRFLNGLKYDVKGIVRH